MSRQRKRELEDLQAGEKYNKIITPKKQRLTMKERRFFLQKNLNKKEAKNDF